MTTAPASYTDGQGRWRVALRDDDLPGVRDVADRLERAVAEERRLPPHDAALRKMMDTARGDAGQVTRELMALLQQRAAQCALSRQDRIDLAEVILRRDVTTWSSLTVGEARRLIDAMEGFAYIAHLQAEQGRKWRYERDRSQTA